MCVCACVRVRVRVRVCVCVCVLPIQNNHMMEHLNTAFIVEMFCCHSGFALVAEGVLSAFYHVCPNDTNFQFGKFTTIAKHVLSLFLLAAYFYL